MSECLRTNCCSFESSVLSILGVTDEICFNISGLSLLILCPLSVLNPESVFLNLPIFISTRSWFAYLSNWFVRRFKIPSGFGVKWEVWQIVDWKILLLRGGSLPNSSELKSALKLHKLSSLLINVRKMFKLTLTVEITVHRQILSCLLLAVVFLQTTFRDFCS